MSQPLIMSFRPEAAEMCLDGRKTMTRRIWKSEMRQHGRIDTEAPIGARPIGFDKCHEISVYYTAFHSRAIWTVGKSIAIKPKRAACAIGRVMCTGLRVEHVQDITEEDAKREGMTPYGGHGYQGTHDGFVYLTAREAFEHVWRKLNKRGSTSWESNPLVVVIEIEPLKEDLKCASSL
jgi:hypothetical protein